MKKLLSVAAAVAVVLTLSSCGSKDEGVITLEEYEKIEIGMSYDEVKDIIGGECEAGAKQELGSISQAVYVCSGANGSAATLTFQNDALALKSQVNLK